MEIQSNNMNNDNTTVSWVRGKCIGKGSFGTVNVAFNKLNGDVFAVKSVDRKKCQLEALENEIQILRRLSSPYIVEYLGDDVSWESSIPYRNLHVEYLTGGTVADLAEADVDEKIVPSYTRCIVSALKYIHSRGIVHCDVKGKNVLVGPNPGSAKLADFGSAVDMSGTFGAPIMPRGSPLWMAPEVIRSEYQGPESDIWSLGCTVIEMVTGEPAWQDRGLDTLSQIGFSDELPEFPTQLSELGRDFVDKCLRRERNQRWSCDQLLQHPFISYACPDMFAEASPRCVLDWFSSEEFSEIDDGDDYGSSTKHENCEVSAKDRIGKLATNSGAKWESDGWAVVRSYAYVCAYAPAPCETEEGREEGTSSVYSDSVWIREEIGRKEGRANWEIENSGVNGSTCEAFGGCGARGCACEAGSCCRYGLQKVDLAVDKRGLLVGLYYGWCNLLSLLHFLTIFRYNILFMIPFYSWPQFVHVNVTVTNHVFEFRRFI